MNGRAHAATGALTNLALAPATTNLTSIPATHAPQLLAWVALGYLGALLPDLDEPNSTLGRRTGPTRTIHALARAAKHHRLTRWLKLPQLLRALAYRATLSYGIRRAAGGHREGTHDIILAPATTLTLATIPVLTLDWPWWLGIPLALGHAVGILGDAITHDMAPVPFTWWRRGRAPRWGIPLFSASNTTACSLVVTVNALVAYAAWRPLLSA